MKEPDVAARLKEIQGTLSLRAFAIACGVNHRRLSDWLAGRNAPDADNLRRIAKAQGVSVDWLLGLPNAPMMREQTRSPAALEYDVGRFLEREIDGRLPAHDLRSPDGGQFRPLRWIAGGGPALSLLVEILLPAAQRQVEDLSELRNTARNAKHLSRAVQVILDEQIKREAAGIAADPTLRAAALEVLARIDQDLKQATQRRNDSLESVIMLVHEDIVAANHPGY